VHYEDFHGAVVADLSSVHDWLNKDEEAFRYQNLTKEKTAQQAEEDDSNEEMRRKKNRLERILMMVYAVQNYKVYFGLYPSSGIYVGYFKSHGK
jgi:hypothetical protein